MTLIPASGCRKGRSQVHNPRRGGLPAERFNRPWIAATALADLHINAAFGEPFYRDLFARVVAGQIEMR